MPAWSIMWRAMWTLWHPSPPASFTPPASSASRRYSSSSPETNGSSSHVARTCFRASSRCFGRLEVARPDGAGVDEQDAVVADALAGRDELVDVLLQRPAPERPPAELHGPEPAPHGSRARLRASAAACRRTAATRTASSGTPSRSRAAGTPARPRLRPSRSHSAMSMPDSVWSAWSRSRLLARTRSPMRTMSAGDLEPLPDDGRRHRLARAVRHRADQAGDAHQRRRLALAPARRARRSR